MNKNTGTTMHKIWMLHLFKQKLHIGLKMINNSQTDVKIHTWTNVSFSFSWAFMPSYLLVSCCMVFLNVSLLLCKLTLSSISFYKKIDIEAMKKLWANTYGYIFTERWSVPAKSERKKPFQKYYLWKEVPVF